jgi:hypothetical protein
LEVFNRRRLVPDVIALGSFPVRLSGGRRGRLITIGFGSDRLFISNLRRGFVLFLSGSFVVRVVIELQHVTFGTIAFEKIRHLLLALDEDFDELGSKFFVPVIVE